MASKKSSKVKEVKEDIKPEPTQRPKSRRGFASMSAEKQLEIARRGGLAAHAKGTAHAWTKEEASIAGKKGALVRLANERRARAVAREAEGSVSTNDATDSDAHL